MRLTHDEVKTLKQAVLERDMQARVFLFGSRVDDSQRGGDIDLLIESKKLTRQDIRAIRRQFFDRFGEQKIDVVLDNGHDNQTFIKMIKPKAERL